MTGLIRIRDHIETRFKQGSKATNTWTALTLIALLLTAPAALAAEETTTKEDNSILALVLTRSYEDGGYTVVHPKTGLSHLANSHAEESDIKKYIVKPLQTDGIDVAGMVDQLFKRNKESFRLTLKSSLKDGYLFDVDGKFKKYFEDNGGGWEKWYADNPKAHGFTTVSRPVYDKKTGLVLVYMGTQSHWLAGSGWVILYKYEKGKLKEINKVMVWIS